MMKQLRNEVYHLELQRIAPENLIDEFDERATIYNAYSGNEVVGTVRCIDSFLNEMEITETHPDIKALINPTKRYVEISRLMILPKHRNGIVSLRLYFQTLMFAARVSAEGMILTCSKSLIRTYNKVGFRLLMDKPIQRKYLFTQEEFVMIFDYSEERVFYNALQPLLVELEGVQIRC